MAAVSTRPETLRSMPPGSLFIRSDPVLHDDLQVFTAAGGRAGAATVQSLLLAAIPYRTFPTLDLGPVELHVFGLAVAVGVFAGVQLLVRYAPEGISREDLLRLSTRLVISGIVGARLTWVLTHRNQIDGPLDVLAIWEGGLQFSGGFLTAVAVGLPTFRKWPAFLRWQILDRMALALAVGMIFGRVGCYAVGEHLGRPTSFFLGTRYDGGETREGPLRVGEVIHNTSLYEMLHLIGLAALLWWLVARRRDRVPSGLALAVFCLWYGAARLATDALRAYDDRTLGLTGAQWMCLALLGVGALLLARTRRAGLSRPPGARTLT